MKDYATQYIGKEVRVVIDRPRGSRHPKHDFVYPVNYGYVPGTQAPDGEGIDAYVLGVNEAVEEYTGMCVAIVHRKDDDDDKLIVCPPKRTFSDDEIKQQVSFQEQWFDSEILR